MKKVFSMVLFMMLITNGAFAAYSVVDLSSADPLPRNHLIDVGTISFDTLYTATNVVSGSINEIFNQSFEFTVNEIFDFGVGVENNPKSIKTLNFKSYIYDLDIDSVGLTRRINDYTSELIASNYDTFSFYLTNLAAGTYVLRLNGTITGTSGGRYDATFQAANPVPVPGAAILLGSAILGLVGFRRTRTV